LIIALQSRIPSLSVSWRSEWHLASVLFANCNHKQLNIQHFRYLIYEFTPRGMLEFEKKLTATIQSELKDEFSYHMLLTAPKSVEENDS
jgi:hypothetical protein